MSGAYFTRVVLGRGRRADPFAGEYRSGLAKKPAQELARSGKNDGHMPRSFS